ncbi:response regulator [Neokomagataea tanensis]|uniref:response regulator n=1 Tax=Neokomagataea TaxID=1223423 RepID=UPI00197B173D|nr:MULTISPECIES: response regulator [Neokomagataea]
MTLRTILIVEDEPFIRFDLVDFFRDRGFHVFEAENADEAIQILATNGIIQAVLTDVHLPGPMDGIRLAHHVRNCCPLTVLVIASGMLKPDDSSLPERAFFVSKPYNLRSVLREIERQAIWGNGEISFENAR